MKSFKVILLIITTLTTPIITTQALAQQVRKDSIIPSKKDALALMQSICGQGNVTQEKGKVVCKKCPSFTGYSGDSGGSLTSVIYGSFTKSGVREALVDLGDCEPHAGNWGGTVLLRRTNNSWSRIRYESGFRSNICLKIPSKTGRHSLVCQGSFMAQGYLSNRLDRFDVGSTKTTSTEILSVGSNIGSCQPPFYEVEIKDFTLRDSNKDRLPDLIVKVSAAREKAGIRRPTNEQCEPRLPKAKLHQLTFLSNGKSFRATPATAKLIKQLEPR